jgi:hypothetical protein
LRKNDKKKKKWKNRKTEKQKKLKTQITQKKVIHRFVQIDGRS